MSVESESLFIPLQLITIFPMDENNVDLLTGALPSSFNQRESVEKSEIELICRRYASDTWSGLHHMSQTPTGYPEDMIRIEDEKETSNNKTSPTNIGLFLASTIAARDMQLQSPEEANHSIDSVLTSLESADTYQGLFYNWYDTQTGEVTGKTDRPFISTVDNAWLTVGLMTIRAASSDPYSERADKIIKQMDSSMLYDTERNLFFGGYYPDTQESSAWHYDILNTEARIASYVWIGSGGGAIPAVNYNHLGKFAPAGSEIPTQHGQLLLSWGGSMFEALMPTLFLPEHEWSQTWENNHRQYITEQIQHGKKYENGFWGISPCYNGTYHLTGLAGLAMQEGGYGPSSDITPHASFLSLPFEPQQAVENLARLEGSYPTFYKKGLGFSDSVNVQTGEESNSYLSLDQEMSLLATYNYLSGNKMYEYISPQLESLQPLVAALDRELTLAT